MSLGFSCTDGKIKTYIDSIKKANKYNNISYILGGGVSHPYELPLWEELLFQLFKNVDNREYFKKQNNDFLNEIFTNSKINVTIIARYLRNLANSHEKWNKLIQNSLYHNFKEHSLLKETFLSKLADILILNENGSTIITYNFDNILDTLILNRLEEKNRYKLNSTYGPGGRVNPSKINIFHVHGYLPIKEDRKFLKQKLIFCEDDYHHSALSPTSWENSIQLSQLLTKTCLFFGTSLTDVNQRRLLDTYKIIIEKNTEVFNTIHTSFGLKNHYAFLKKPTDKTELALAKMNEAVLNDLKIKVIWYENHSDLMQFFKIFYE